MSRRTQICAALLGGLMVSIGLPWGGGPSLAQPHFENVPDRRSDWRRVITAPDLDRLRNWREALVRGLAAAREAGFAPQIDALGSVLAINARQERNALVAGRYQCRMIWLSALGQGSKAFALDDAKPCRIRSWGEALHMEANDGARRFSGYLYNDGPDRRIFLGSVIYPDESTPMVYGQDDKRDAVGFVERIGDQHWRLILPYPRDGALVKIIEITP